MRIAQVADDLTTTLLRARQRVHGAPRDAYTRQLCKDVSGRRADPARLLVTLLVTALADGAPLEDVRAFPRQLDAALCAAAGVAPRLSESEVQQREALRQGEFDQPQIRRAYDKSPAVLREIIERGLAHIEAIHDVVTWASRELYGEPARPAAAPRPVPARLRATRAIATA